MVHGTSRQSKATSRGQRVLTTRTTASSPFDLVPQEQRNILSAIKHASPFFVYRGNNIVTAAAAPPPTSAKSARSSSTLTSAGVVAAAPGSNQRLRSVLLPFGGQPSIHHHHQQHTAVADQQHLASRHRHHHPLDYYRLATPFRARALANQATRNNERPAPTYSSPALAFNDTLQPTRSNPMAKVNVAYLNDSPDGHRRPQFPMDNMPQKASAHFLRQQSLPSYANDERFDNNHNKTVITVNGTQPAMMSMVNGGRYSNPVDDQHNEESSTSFIFPPPPVDARVVVGRHDAPPDLDIEGGLLKGELNRKHLSLSNQSLIAANDIGKRNGKILSRNNASGVTMTSDVPPRQEAATTSEEMAPPKKSSSFGQFARGCCSKIFILLVIFIILALTFIAGIAFSKYFYMFFHCDASSSSSSNVLLAATSSLPPLMANSKWNHSQVATTTTTTTTMKPTITTSTTTTSPTTASTTTTTEMNREASTSASTTTEAPGETTPETSPPPMSSTSTSSSYDDFLANISDQVTSEITSLFNESIHQDSTSNVANNVTTVSAQMTTTIAPTTPAAISETTTTMSEVEHETPLVLHDNNWKGHNMSVDISSTPPTVSLVSSTTPSTSTADNNTDPVVSVVNPNNITAAADNNNSATTLPPESQLICSSTQFMCPNTTNKFCLNQEARCDGIVDCPLDHFDELDCDKINCGENHMCGGPGSEGNVSVASSMQAMCISRDSYCDGVWDCPNGSDEIACRHNRCYPNEIQCRDGSACIQPKQACDGIYNCRDHSDEIDCVSKSLCEKADRFFCPRGLCIDRSLVCDGRNDCVDGADELGCATSDNCSLAQGRYRCSSGKCIDVGRRCDGHDDCGDFDDETRCIETEKSTNIVHIFNGQQQNWSLYCSPEDFGQTSADELCQELGFDKASNYSLIAISRMLANGTWAHFTNDGRIEHVHTCASNRTVAVECAAVICSQSRSTDTTSNQPIPTNTLPESSPPQPMKIVLTSPAGNATTAFPQTVSCFAYPITSRWLVTSGMCLRNLTNYSKDNFDRLAVVVVVGGETQTISIESVRLHPRYSIFRTIRYPDNDLALMKMKNMINESMAKTFGICLPEAKVDAAITCFVHPDDHQQGRPVDTSYEIIDMHVCNSTEHYAGHLTDNHLCGLGSSYSANDYISTTPIHSTRNQCFENFRALNCLNSLSKWYLAGFLSHQHGCHSLAAAEVFEHDGQRNFVIYRRHPLIFSNIFEMKSFVEQTIGWGGYRVSRKTINVSEIVEDSNNNNPKRVAFVRVDDEKKVEEQTNLTTISKDIDANTTMTTRLDIFNATNTNQSMMEELTSTTATTSEATTTELSSPSPTKLSSLPPSSTTEIPETLSTASNSTTTTTPLPTSLPSPTTETTMPSITTTSANETPTTTMKFEEDLSHNLSTTTPSSPSSPTPSNQTNLI